MAAASMLALQRQVGNAAAAQAIGKQPAGGDAVTIQRLATLDLRSADVAGTGSDEVAGADPEQVVTLFRGVVPTQQKYMDTEIMNYSYVSLSDMMSPEGAEPETEVAEPSLAAAQAYIRSDASGDAVGNIEFTSDRNIAKNYAVADGKVGYIVTVQIQRKYLTQGATGSELGWIADARAPYKVVYVDEGRKAGTEREWTGLDSPEAVNAVVAKEGSARRLRDLTAKTTSGEALTPQERQEFVKLKMAGLAEKRAETDAARG